MASGVYLIAEEEEEGGRKGGYLIAWGGEREGES
jgi:hypothetical protein